MGMEGGNAPAKTSGKCKGPEAEVDWMLAESWEALVALAKGASGHDQEGSGRWVHVCTALEARLRSSYSVPRVLTKLGKV